MKYVLPFGAFLILATTLHGAPCENVKTLALPNTSISMAQSVAPGAFTAPGGRGGDLWQTDRYVYWRFEVEHARVLMRCHLQSF